MEKLGKFGKNGEIWENWLKIWGELGKFEKILENWKIWENLGNLVELRNLIKNWGNLRKFGEIWENLRKLIKNLGRIG